MRYIVPVYILLIFLSDGAAQVTAITSVTPLATTVGRYEKFEIRVGFNGAYANPYDYDEVHLQCTFTSPAGNAVKADGFYMQDYMLNTGTGSLTPAGSGVFKVRFAPHETGIWTYLVNVTTTSGHDTFAELTFECTPSSPESNRGFIRRHHSRYLVHDDGSPYIPIGENMAWHNNNPYLNFTQWLNKLADHGGNFIRLWHAHWGLGLEWRNGQDQYAGLRRYKQSNGFYQDWLFDFCAEKDVYVMLCLQHHGQVSTGVNPNWNESPYNAANGGPCANTWDFFTSEQARAHTRNRLRYVVARWGYARSILCWELFNEVHWTDQFQQRKGDVGSWHREMAEFIREIDPYQHLITTSYGDSLDDEAVWSHPDVDFTQTHIYLNSSNIERALAAGVRQHTDAFQKPSLNGEFGLGGSSSLANTDPDGIHIHNAMWGSLFGGGLGAAMTWWWDTYIHPRDLYYHFEGISKVAAGIPFAVKEMSPVPAAIDGAQGDLVLTPTLGWGGIGTPFMSIDASGQVLPADAALGTFLYGSLWNTQFRSPPRFNVVYPENGYFTVRTGSDSGTDPRIRIILNGVQQLTQPAVINTGYTVQVPAGSHVIEVDNTGTDWITIHSYTFSGLGRNIDAYVLKSAGGEEAAGWLLNHRYNHEYIVQHGAPPVVDDAALNIPGLQSGRYGLTWYDCLTGAIAGTQEIELAGGEASIPVPPLLWDIAFSMVRLGSVPVHDLTHPSPYRITPNPVMAGSAVRIIRGQLYDGTVTITIFDATGREMLQERLVSPYEVLLPQHLSDGIYFIRVAEEEYVCTQLLSLWVGSGER